MTKDDKLSLFFGESKDVTTKEPKLTEVKGWSEDWLKMKEKNLLESGDTLSNPYSQSYIVYRAIRSIAENIPQAKYKIIDLSTEKAVGPENDLFKLFIRPNRYTSRFEMWEAIGTYLNLNGEVFLFPVESVGGAMGRGTAPAELWVLDPAMIQHSVVDGRVEGWSWNGQVPFDLDELIHFKLFNPGAGNFRGLSPLAAAQNEMNADYAAGVYNNVFFKNNATPDGVIEVDKDKEIDIKDLRKIKNMWYEKHGGQSNAHKTAFLLGGMSYRSMGFTQKDMDYIQGRHFSRDAVLSVFGSNKFVAGFYDSGLNRATAEQAKREFWTGTLKPQLIRIEEKLAAEFFPKYAPGYSGVFDYSEVEVLQEDFNASVLTAKELQLMGYTRNEANERMKLGMPHEDTDGDIRYMPIQLIEVGEAEEMEPIEEDKSFQTKAFEKASAYRRQFLHFQKQMEKLLQAKLKRFIFSQRTKVLKLFTTGFKADLTPEQMQMIGELKSIFEDGKEALKVSVEPVYRETMTEAGEMAYRNLGLAADRQFLLNEEILVNRLNMISGMNDTVYDKVKSEIYTGIKSGEGVDQISSRIKSVYNTTSNRAKIIARTETSSLMNGTTELIYKEEGVKQKVWLTAGDSAVRDTHTANQEQGPIPIGRQFSNGLMYPGDPNGEAKEVINCRCALAPFVEA